MVQYIEFVDPTRFDAIQASRETHNAWAFWDTRIVGGLGNLRCPGIPGFPVNVAIALSRFPGKARFASFPGISRTPRYPGRPR